MRRAFILLLLLTVLLYAHEGYKTWRSAWEVEPAMSGSLSDMASEVKPIPLQHAHGKAIDSARQVRQDRGNLFFISEQVLYRYTNQGEFVCAITDPGQMDPRMYVVDPVREELIVFGNYDEVHYYDYNGQLLDKQNLDDNGQPYRRILSVNWYQNHLLSIEENSYTNPDTGEVYVQKEVVTYDRNLQRVDARTLCAVDLGRPNYLLDLIEPQLCVDPDTGRLVVYSPSMDPGYLPADTTYLDRNWRTELMAASAGGTVPVVPVRRAGRFWLSSLYDACDDEDQAGYSFYYDLARSEYTTVEGGIQDNFYGTGRVHLEPMDISHHSFYFSQSGEAVKKLFPEGSTAGNTVVFIVQMKEA
ncbi:hypothetical protein LJB97_05515 [Parabacteroides sp. OttesenSCG-928-O15]|nr:hypothetical protein [Parabacteroides sp. OttesenSCG-928-O15]